MSNAESLLGPHGPYVPPPDDDDAAWFDYAARLMGGHSGPADDFPDFMLIGGGRSGTSWMFTTLQRHPFVFVGPHQEIHHFTSDWHNNPIATYCGYYAGYRHKIKGDFTPVTALLPRPAIRAIHTLNPNLKILYSIRNPMDHAWAMIRHMINHRAYAFTELERTGQITTSMLAKFLVSDYAIASSDHASVLARWLDVFPAEQFFVYFVDDLGGPRPEVLVENIQRFLGLPIVDPRQIMPSGRVKAGLDGLPPDFIKPFITALWRTRMLRLMELLRSRFALVAPAAWQADVHAPSLTERIPLFDGPAGQQYLMCAEDSNSGLFVEGTDGPPADYLLDLHLAPYADQAPWEISDWRQARIIRQMNAELFMRPVAPGRG